VRGGVSVSTGTPEVKDVRLTIFQWNGIGTLKNREGALVNITRKACAFSLTRLVARAVRRFSKGHGKASWTHPQRGSNLF
jgi:hypothetical protein